MFYEKCDRCQKGDENRYKGSRRARTVILLGEFHSILCPECVNDWAMHIRGQVEYIRISHVQDRVKAAVYSGDGEAAVALTQEDLEAKQAMYDIAKVFVAEDIHREEPGA